MIAYDLCCENNHCFEMWFKDAASFDRQAKRRLVGCVVCGSVKLKKQLSAPALAGTRSQNAKPAAAPKAYANASEAKEMAEVMTKLTEMRRAIEANADNVGEAFAEEARKIHYGEVERRNIYGDATDQDAAALREEGVEFARIPWVRRADS